MTHEPPLPDEADDRDDDSCDDSVDLDSRDDSVDLDSRDATLWREIKRKLKREGREVRDDVWHIVHGADDQRFRLRPFHLAILMLTTLGATLLFWKLIAPQGDPIYESRMFSGVVTMVVACLVFFALWAVGVVHRLIDEEHGLVLLSPEVVAVVLGAVITITSGSFAVNHLMESVESQKHQHRIAIEEYERQAKIVERFADRGQKVLFYAYMYRVAEEWLEASRVLELIYESASDAEGQNSTAASIHIPPPFPLAYDRFIEDERVVKDDPRLHFVVLTYQQTTGIDQYDAMVEAYYRYLLRFVEAGSIELSCVEILIHFEDRLAAANPDGGRQYDKGQDKFDGEKNQKPEVQLYDLIQTFESQYEDLIGDRGSYSGLEPEGVVAELGKKHEAIRQHYVDLRNQYHTIVERLNTRSTEFFDRAYHGVSF